MLHLRGIMLTMNLTWEVWRWWMLVSYIGQRQNRNIKGLFITLFQVLQVRDGWPYMLSEYLIWCKSEALKIFFNGENLWVTRVVLPCSIFPQKFCSVFKKNHFEIMSAYTFENFKTVGCLLWFEHNFLQLRNLSSI